MLTSRRIRKIWGDQKVLEISKVKEYRRYENSMIFEDFERIEDIEKHWKLQRIQEYLKFQRIRRVEKSLKVSKENVEKY